MLNRLLIAAAALSLAGCDAIKTHLADKSAKPAPPAAAPAASVTAAAEAPPAAAPVAPAAEAAAVPAAAQAPAAPAAPAVQVVRFSPVDYAKRERRLNALIANAETRDTSGETQRRAEEGRYRRSRCSTRACIEASYAAEESWLRQWEGSGDVK
jgi:hypothetical protein